MKSEKKHPQDLLNVGTLFGDLIREQPFNTDGVGRSNVGRLDLFWIKAGVNFFQTLMREIFSCLTGKYF